MGDVSRVKWIDVAKGIGIVLVVIGHTNRGLASSGVIDWSSTFETFDRWIYSFHMPLFFFLSGLFLTKSASNSYSLFLKDKIYKIAYPYVVWSTISILIKSLLGTAVNSPRSVVDLPLIFYSPVDQFWFLYALFLGVLLLGALYHGRLNPWLVVVMAAIVSSLPVSWSWGVLHELKSYILYIALGSAVGLRLVSFIPNHYLGPLAVGGFSFIFFVQDEPFAALAGISAAVAASVLVSNTRVGEVLSFLGRHSLEIFVCHTIASAGIRIALLRCGIDNPAAHIAIGIGSGLLLPIGLTLMLQRFGFNYAFAIPTKKSAPLKIENIGA